jgi:hypothetical protein
VAGTIESGSLPYAVGYRFCFDAQALAIRESLAFEQPRLVDVYRGYRTPAITYWDECVRHFVTHVLCGVCKADGSLDVKVMSGIREYDGNLYIASLGTGKQLRLATVVRSGQVPIRDLADELYAQTGDPFLGRTVYGHRRFIQTLPKRWQSRFQTTPV